MKCLGMISGSPGVHTLEQCYPASPEPTACWLYKREYHEW